MANPLSTIQQCRLYAGFELQRLWLTRRGLMTLAATAVIWFFLLRYAIAPASDLISADGFQQFFRDGPPPLSVVSQKQLRRKSSSKTAKKKGHLHHHHPNNVFYVDKTTAVKNMHNKTIRNK